MIVDLLILELNLTFLELKSFFQSLMSCHAPFPAAVLAAALRPCAVERNVGLPHGSYGLLDGLPHQPL